MSMLSDLLRGVENGESGGGGDQGGATIYTGTITPDDGVGKDGDVYFLVYASPSGIVADDGYVVTSTTQMLSSHSQVFYKTTEEPAIAVEWKAGYYYGPYLVGLSKNAVKYTGNTNESKITSATINGVTWFLSSSEYWSAGTDSPTIPTMYNSGAQTTEEIIRAILEASHARAVADIWIIKDAYYKAGGNWSHYYIPTQSAATE